MRDQCCKVQSCAEKGTVLLSTSLAWPAAAGPKLSLNLAPILLLNPVWSTVLSNENLVQTFCPSIITQNHCKIGLKSEGHISDPYCILHIGYHCSARRGKSINRQRLPSFWRRNFNFGATAKSPAQMKKVQYGSLKVG